MLPAMLYDIFVILSFFTNWHYFKNTEQHEDQEKVLSHPFFSWFELWPLYVSNVVVLNLL